MVSGQTPEQHVPHTQAAQGLQCPLSHESRGELHFDPLQHVCQRPPHSMALCSSRSGTSGHNPALPETANTKITRALNIPLLARRHARKSVKKKRQEMPLPRFRNYRRVLHAFHARTNPVWLMSYLGMRFLFLKPVVQNGSNCMPWNPWSIPMPMRRLCKKTRLHVQVACVPRVAIHPEVKELAPLWGL